MPQTFLQEPAMAGEKAVGSFRGSGSSKRAWCCVACCTAGWEADPRWQNHFLLLNPRAGCRPAFRIFLGPVKESVCAHYVAGIACSTGDRAEHMTGQTQAPEQLYPVTVFGQLTCGCFPLFLLLCGFLVFFFSFIFF